MLTCHKVIAAHKAGWFDGAAFKKATPAAVPGLAPCVAAYMAGWAKGWLDMTAYNAKFATKGA